MSVGVLVPNGNSEIEKLNDTLQLLSKVSLSLRTSSEDVNLDRPRNRNHSNSARSSGSAHRTPSFGKRDNDACYSCVHKIRRGGRVAKKWPSRQGFPPNRYPPQTSAPVYQPTGMQGGMNPNPGRSNLPVVPPKTGMRIMSPEELADHEAQVKLRQRQQEEANLEQRLAIQRKQAEEDDKWIQQEEQQFRKIPPTNGESDDPDHLYQSADDVRRGRAKTIAEAPPPPNAAPPKPPRNPPSTEVPVPAPPKLSLEEVKPTPTMKLDREGDSVYRDTMNVVKSVLTTNHETMDAQPDEIFILVKNIGKALKELCTSLDQEMPSLPEQFHRAIDMAQKTTNKDLSQIINQMKLVKKFYATTQVTAYKKCMMAATQVLAMDAKNLLDVVDKARLHKLHAEQPSTSSPSPPPESPREQASNPDDFAASPSGEEG
ncbi:unnamed protein product [Clavelina lepadiformis]|uniref:Focal AT domain-containing protein n=1 Tax=Clavelina lepadiformis TaxID=159417 RepID=A0ABP0GHF7_CLALP